MVADMKQRARRLSEPHVAPLEQWRETIASGRAMPHFDPFDGGACARLLILLETPRAMRGQRSSALRFVSRDNPSGTQRNLSRFLDEAGIARSHMLLWNCVPWVVHEPGAINRRLRRAEIAEGLDLLPGLLAILPRVQVVVLAGKVASEAGEVIAIQRPDVSILYMPHPSPANVCTSPRIGQSIRTVLSDAAARLE